MNDKTAPSRTVAAAFLDVLAVRGIRHVFANAGTDTAPIIEAMAEATEQKRQIPRFHIIPHENVAVAMAHGYYLACGEPSAVLVHVTVGTANALCGVMNASRDNVPLLLLAGRTPNTESGYAGSRSLGIHWGQDSFDQGGIVREYVKWDYELRAGQPVDAVVGRALDIAMSEPCGPVYLTMPREVLAEPALAGSVLLRDRSLRVSPAEPAADAIDSAAKAIAEAEFPLIITAAAGRDPRNVELLALLADDFGIAVAYPGVPGPRALCIPTDHSMYLGMSADNALARADVLVVIDCEVPWLPKYAKPRTDAKLVHIGPDPLFSRYPLRGFGWDLAIAGSSTAALRMLRDAIKSFVDSDNKAIQARRAEIARLAQERRRRLHEATEQVADRRPIHPNWVARCVNRITGPDTTIVNELGLPMDLLDLREPRSYFTVSSASGLGFALGAAMGAKLARPDRQIITLIGDGSYMFGNPVPAHFVANAEGLPTLTVVMNNGRWHAVNSATRAMYPDGWAAVSESMPLVDLSPSPAFERIMDGCGGHGERVEAPDELLQALQRGLDAVKRGVPTLLNVITQPIDA